MSHETRTIKHVEADALFALAAAELPEGAASAANAHLALCRGCRRLYAGARELQQEAVRLGDVAASGVDDMTHRRLWQSLAPEAAAAAQRTQQRRAWSIVLANPRLRWAAAIVVFVGAGLLVYGLGVGPATTSAAPSVGGAAAAQRQAREVGLPPALGPGTRSKLADSLRSAAPQQGKDHRPGRRKHQRRARRQASSVAMDLDLTGPVPRPTPGSLTPVPGERRLRCGGLLAAQGGVAQILHDKPQSALIKLRTGRLGMRVPKLPRGGRVVIVTPDARVRVVGTSFTVSRGAKPQTTVAVSEGVVWVMPTGRNRMTIVLRAGDSQTVLGEAAYLMQLRGLLTTALGAGRLKAAARLGRRYLDVTSKPGGEATMKLRLAGILARLGRTAGAVKLYQDVMGSAPHAVARQNALAFLARLYERLGKTPKALGIWRGLVKKHPRGLFAVDALMALVRAECGQAGVVQTRHRRRLAKRSGSHRAAKALLQRCRPKGTK